MGSGLRLPSLTVPFFLLAFIRDLPITSNKKGGGRNPFTTSAIDDTNGIVNTVIHPVILPTWQLTKSQSLFQETLFRRNSRFLRRVLSYFLFFDYLDWARNKKYPLTPSDEFYFTGTLITSISSSKINMFSDIVGFVGSTNDISNPVYQ